MRRNFDLEKYVVSTKDLAIEELTQLAHCMRYLITRPENFLIIIVAPLTILMKHASCKDGRREVKGRKEINRPPRLLADRCVIDICVVANCAVRDW